VLWARVLNSLPASRLLIGAAGSWRAQQRITETLGAHGVDEGRVEFASRLPYVKYLDLRNRVDISLDTFPHGGGTTTCETLWMGVPVVTRIGAALASRAGYSLLHAVGLEGHAAFDDDRFIACATHLAADLDALGALRAGMRERIRASSLCDEAGFAAAIEAVYRKAWRDWCAAPR
jgi:predicted O-linked N-acetylglucosamine transferase (SPINDLY family)